MVFFSQKVLRKLAGNWTFVVVTDRVELDEQIAKTFKAVGAVSETDGDECHASSGAHLRELLRPMATTAFQTMYGARIKEAREAGLGRPHLPRVNAGFRHLQHFDRASGGALDRDIHAAAGDRAAAERGERGLLASDLTHRLPAVLNP